ncbi:MAG TPA: LLM class flavin-dependent oxidoreductase [Solirubrobacteraceae bacterium]|jgi:luciferase family oxidoreductase group 1|nr:LLM class flavin-dependent oxidoreductase [Solirubrobacteraceae bacterium]
MSVPLSVLDLAPIGAGQRAADALAGTTRLAQRADELGFRRFWVAEHHNIPSVASTAPEVLIAHIAASTERIRVGSGGVMLPNHAPLAVAERFGMLEALHPDRIDLGLGRAPGTDMRTAMALRSTSPELFEQQYAQLLDHLGEGHGGMRAVAGKHTLPQVWMLGSTDGGARIAAALGMPFVFAHHFHPHFTEPALELYRGLFVPSESLDAPRTIVAAGVVVGDDDEDAVRRALPGGVSMLRLRQGRPAPIPSIEQAETEVARLGAAELAVVDEAIARAIVGSAETVHAALLELAERSGADELMLTSQVADPEQRIQALERVAQAFELTQSPART